MSAADSILFSRSGRAASHIFPLMICTFVAVVMACGGRSSAGCVRPDDERFADVKDSQDAQRFVGMTRDQVEAKFGAPSERFGFDWDATYWMRNQGFCMDGWYLALEYNARGEVVAAQVLPG